MMTKLHINLAQGIVDVEGDPEFVSRVYSDFKDQLLSGTAFSPPEREDSDSEAKGSLPKNQPKVRRRAAPRKRAVSGDDTSGVSADHPKLDKNLDTAKLGDFYGQFKPKNNAERILIFLKYIIDELGIENPNTDQVYTCFKKTGDKIPKAFAQAFYNVSSREGYIDFRSASDIGITIVGDNHFNLELKRKEAE
ncbi:hypothetical protein [Altererythrobacter sp.]|uniref:hypothetical protein n=1 Tax=Altererythrobacter sp. TaxID=1872480 RepID=UPI003D0A29AE